MGHSDDVNTVNFSPDGKILASGSYDHTIKLWNFDLDHLLQKGCKWISGYLKTNPNVKEEDRSICDEFLQDSDFLNTRPSQ